MNVEHSTDNGRTWQVVTPHDRSPLVAILAEMAPYEIYDDGMGNLYRWRDDA